MQKIHIRYRTWLAFNQFNHMLFTKNTTKERTMNYAERQLITYDSDN